MWSAYQRRESLLSGCSSIADHDRSGSLKRPPVWLHDHHRTILLVVVLEHAYVALATEAMRKDVWKDGG